MPKSLCHESGSGMNAGLSVPWSWSRLLGWPLLGFVAILASFSLFNIDRGFENWLYSPDHGFPFQQNEWYELWLHDRIKFASNNLVWVILAAAIWPNKNLQWREYRVPLLLALVAAIVSVVVMRLLKDATGIYCPYQLQDYGGDIQLHPRIRLGYLILINDGAGRCWPGGHSTVGFAWLSLFFAFRQMSWPRMALGALVLALAYGHFLGLVQVVRGQHFLSHQFYTMAFCWIINLVLFYAWYRYDTALLRRQKSLPS